MTFDDMFAIAPDAPVPLLRVLARNFEPDLRADQLMWLADALSEYAAWRQMTGRLKEARQLRNLAGAIAMRVPLVIEVPNV